MTERHRAIAQSGSNSDGIHAYGVPVHASHRLYGIVRPCPGWSPFSPQLAYHQAIARNAKEVQALEAGGLGTSRLTHVHLADHEQIALC
ncbi:hypothetical protein Snoj_28280 [Streptomyces nojiriensis]|uniref:Uncharacterized protein n=1 Tax=Streptomyces nojiriensis TaxID=66374 RepID=A0ABQ3SM56_9ACTN|nr:hypothetical protein [Streptomyces nojiriensis]QTI42507.1 hypothetical protein JYK04_00265 [Streptomyces nojiriensis]GGS40569.1 hypothetical protein GCM10010205_82360 [Streptomyces nojiriensis]GHI68910.1 hypothetical protein Snoj_28280 [Streptomyces nojiriensis]